MNHLISNNPQKKSCNIAVKHTDSKIEKKAFLKDESNGNSSGKSTSLVGTETEVTGSNECIR